MGNSDSRLKDVDIASAVEYYGEMELLDFIGASRIEAYLVSAHQEYADNSAGPWTKVHLHQHVATAKVQLGDKCKMTIQADFVAGDGNEVVIDVRMDRIFGVFLQQRASDVA